MTPLTFVISIWLVGSLIALGIVAIAESDWLPYEQLGFVELLALIVGWPLLLWFVVNEFLKDKRG